MKTLEAGRFEYPTPPLFGRATEVEGATEMEAFQQSEQAAAAFAANPALLRLRELDALKELARSANARIYIGFDKHAAPRAADD